MALWYYICLTSPLFSSRRSSLLQFLSWSLLICWFVEEWRKTERWWTTAVGACSGFCELVIISCSFWLKKKEKKKNLCVLIIAKIHVNINSDAEGVITRKEGWMSGAIYTNRLASLQQNGTMHLLNDVSDWHVHILTHTHAHAGYSSHYSSS